MQLCTRKLQTTAGWQVFPRVARVCVNPPSAYSQVCVPRLEAAAKLKLSQTDMENHILIPAKVRGEEKAEDNRGQFKSVNGKVSV